MAWAQLFQSKQQSGSLDLHNARNAHIFTHWQNMPSLETSTKKIIARLLRDGWVREAGGKHDKYRHEQRPGLLIVVPRHRSQSPGVARSIAKAAGWL
jgi:predicted RNA binding protein YcfA (HicA-like mRNA interferase family)